MGGWGSVSDLHVFIAFWAILSIIFVILFGDKKTVNFPESPKCVAVGGWVRFLGLYPKKKLN